MLYLLFENRILIGLPCQTGSRVPWVEWACHTVIRLTGILWPGDGVGLISPAILILCRVVEVSPNSGRQKGCSASVPEQETATETPDLIAAKRVKTVCSVFRFILPDRSLTVINGNAIP